MAGAAQTLKMKSPAPRRDWTWDCRVTVLRFYHLVTRHPWFQWLGKDCLRLQVQRCDLVLELGFCCNLGSFNWAYPNTQLDQNGKSSTSFCQLLAFISLAALLTRTCRYPLRPTTCTSPDHWIVNRLSRLTITPWRCSCCRPALGAVQSSRSYVQTGVLEYKF